MIDKKQYLYLLKPIRSNMLTEGSSAEEAMVVEQHVEYLRKLAEEGVVVLFGRTQNEDETTFGLVIFEIDSDEQAERIMRDDPAVAQKVMSAKLFPYKIAGSRYI